MNPTLPAQRAASGDRKVIRRIASLMASRRSPLAIAATLHCPATCTADPQPFNPDRPGSRGDHRHRSGRWPRSPWPRSLEGPVVGLVLNGLATLGFPNGLTMTPEAATYPTSLPPGGPAVLIASFSSVLLRARTSPRRKRDRAGDAWGGGSHEPTSERICRDSKPRRPPQLPRRMGTGVCPMDDLAMAAGWRW